MKAQYFVYTRNFDNDYKSIFSPSEDFCPQNIRKKFLSQARGIINVEQFDDPLDNEGIRWFYSRYSDYILWGVGCNNNALSEDCNKDFAGRLVRGFFGIIINAKFEDIYLPFDISFFRDLYTKHIIPLWMADREQFTRHSIDVELEIANYHILQANGSLAINLNFDPHKSVILGDVDVEQAFQCILATKKDSSLVVGFSSKPHAFCKDYNYMNSIVKGVTNYEEKSHLQTPVFDNKTSVNEPINPVIPPKKVLSPKLIKVAILLIIGITILLTIPKKCKTNASEKFHNTSTSGDTIKKDTQAMPSNSFPTKKKKK